MTSDGEVPGATDPLPEATGLPDAQESRAAKGLPPRRAVDPLHGVTLQTIVERLFERYGWEGLAERVKVRCFENDPSVKSSLAFLRRTPWARQKVEQIYLRSFHSKPRRPDGRPKPKT